MRVAILADIHGNGVALDAVLADLAAQPPDRYVCLGDTALAGPQPAQALSRLRALDCPVVLGNGDAALLTDEVVGDAAHLTAATQELRSWTLAQLAAADRAFLTTFAPTVTIPLPGARDLLCFHGSPASFDDVLLPTTPHDEFERLLGPYASHLLTGGHTHQQQLRQLGETFFCNPGSVGFSFHRERPGAPLQVNPWAEYAVLTATEDRLGLEFRRVPFDLPALIAAYQTSGRPDAGTTVALYQR